MLYPLECESLVTKKATEGIKDNSVNLEEQKQQDETNSKEDKIKRPRRQAAGKAREQLRRLFNDEINTFIWCPECREPRIK